jgi:iron complex outermembrane receptor protein
MKIGTRTSCGLRRKSSAVALAVAGILSNAALAQTAAPSALEEIVVTAERRDINLQELPTSATVLTASSLASQGIDNIIEIQQVAPSVSINTYNRGTFINIRGVGIAQSAPTSVPGVATYIDGVYIPHETFISQSFYDIESIEVLRGPQGTLTGQNSTGGAVYMRTPAPSVDGFSAYIDQTVAEYDWFRTVGAVNLPIGDAVALRIAGVYETRDSFTDNIGKSPSEPGSSNLRGIRAALRVKPLDGMTFDLRYEYFDYESDYNAVKRRNDTVSSDPFVIQEDAISFLNQNGYRASVEARIDLGSSMQLRALTSILNGDNYDQADGDRTDTALPVPPGSPTNTANTTLYPGRVGYTEQSFETKVSEVNLLSTGDSKLQWVVGAFYMDETTPVKVLRDNRNTLTFVQSNSDVIAEADNKSQSVFGQIDFRLTDAWALDLGVRYSEDQQDYTRFALPGPNPGPPYNCFPCTTTAESSATTGRAGVKNYIGEDTMLYLTASRGYKAGGVNLDPRLGNFEPETNTVGEFGVKTTIADGRLRANGSVFYSDYDGIQLSALKSVGAGPPLPNTLNAAKSTIYGSELELTGQFDKLGWNFAVSYLHAEFSENTLLTDNSVVPSIDKPVLKGTPLPFSPEITASAGVQYDFGIGDMTLTPRIQATYMDEQYATSFPGPITTVPSRTVADFRLTLVPFESLRVEAFVTNLLDKTYIAVQVQEASSASGGIIYGAPRQAGMRVKYDF